MEIFRQRTAVPAVHCLEPVGELQCQTASSAEKQSNKGSTPTDTIGNGSALTSGLWVVMPGVLPLPALRTFIETFNAEYQATHVLVGGPEDAVLAVLCCCTRKARYVATASTEDLGVVWTETAIHTILDDAACECPSHMAQRCAVPSDRVYSQSSRDSASLFAVDDCFYEPAETMLSCLFITFDPDSLADTSALLPLEFFLNEPTPIGAYGRLLRDGAENSKVSDCDSTTSLTLTDVDIIAVTTNRWRCIRELLRSIRSRLGDAPTVTVVAQTPSSPAWKYLAKRFDTRIIHVEDDFGLSASRNAAVEVTHRPLVWLMDDDFQLDERCRTQDALRIMSAQPTIDVLGGNLLDVSGWSAPREAEQSQSFAMRALRDQKHLTWIRLEDSPRERYFCDYSTYVEYCDIVDNFAIFRRETTFDRGVRWNQLLKINSEHQDLYLKLLNFQDVTVARTNALKVRNVRIQSSNYRRMRSRQHEFFGHFFRAHELSSFRILGGWARLLCNDGRTAARAFNSPWGHKPEFTISRERV